MSILKLLRREKENSDKLAEANYTYEFCPKCDANLTMQKGYDNALPYWICLGCGELLTNPEIPENESGITWICDKCGAMLNIQENFTEAVDAWACTVCGYENKIDASEIYFSEDEFRASLLDVYRGMSDEAVMEILSYEEVGPIDGREDITLIKDSKGKLFVKKVLTTYEISIYEFLRDNPVQNMPRIYGVYEGTNCLIVIEEYIQGKTIAALLDENVFVAAKAIKIAYDVTLILQRLHSLSTPMIHRDVKPSNVMLDENAQVFLLDVDVAKWYRPEEVEDTKLLGTRYFAAPEQAGYGFSASTEKSDVYAVGMLLNVMLTGKLPKNEKAAEPMWSVIERCISLEQTERYTDVELLDALDSIMR